MADIGVLFGPDSDAGCLLKHDSKGLSLATPGIQHSEEGNLVADCYADGCFV
jgi:hypothetical protein